MLRVGSDESGKSRAESWGASQPKNEGPSRMPTIISAITGGCRIFAKSGVARRHAATMTAICRSRSDRLDIARHGRNQTCRAMSSDQRWQERDTNARAIICPKSKLRRVSVTKRRVYCTNERPGLRLPRGIYTKLDAKEPAMRRLIAVLWTISMLVPAVARAQAFPPNETGVTMGHW